MTGNPENKLQILGGAVKRRGGGRGRHHPSGKQANGLHSRPKWYSEDSSTKSQRKNAFVIDHQGMTALQKAQNYLQIFLLTQATLRVKLLTALSL
jgi:hypothetical protein